MAWRKKREKENQKEKEKEKEGCEAQREAWKEAAKMNTNDTDSKMLEWHGSVPEAASTAGNLHLTRCAKKKTECLYSKQFTITVGTSSFAK